MSKGKGRQLVKTSRNDNRPNGKAFKKRPVDLAKRYTGRTVNGYSPAKLRLRAEKRAYVKSHTPNEVTIEALEKAAE